MLSRNALAFVPIALALGLSALAQEPPAAPADAPTEAAAPEVQPITYKLNPAQGLVYVRVFKDETTLAAGLSHNHAMKATGWTGSVVWDPANTAACKVDITVPVEKIDVDAADARKAAGLDGGPDDDDRKKIKESMLDDDQLDAGKYKDISFKSTGCEGSGDTFTVKGNFTMRGQTKPVSIPMKIHATSTAFDAKGTFSIKGTDFGMQPFTALLGQLKNQDKLTFEIDVRGAP